MERNDVILKLQSLDKAFGGVHVTRNVDFEIRKGERVAIIGPNGAGKTTLMQQICGACHPDSGSVFINGSNVTSASERTRTRAGLARTFQIPSLADELSVEVHIALAVSERMRLAYRFTTPLLEVPQVRDQVDAVLSEVGLIALRKTFAKLLSSGDRKLLDFGIALALKPSLLLLDEPMAGVERSDRHRILDILNLLPHSLTIVLIEHDMELVFQFADRVICLADGEVIADGSPQEVRSSPAVREAYFAK